MELAKMIALVVVTLGAAMPLHALARPAALTTVSGVIGCHSLSLRVRAVADSARFAVRPADCEYVAITEVHLGSPTPRPYHYLVSGTRIAPFERTHAARGFGPVTYFLRPNGNGRAAWTIDVRNLAGSSNPPRILSVRGVTQADLDRARAGDRFTLMGTVINPVLGMPEDEQATRLARDLPTAHDRGIGRGFSYEVLYAARDRAAVRAQLMRARDWSRRCHMPVLLGFVSWWNGTPLRVPDGLGGTFADLKYQQVCYTPDAEHPENPDLRKLLGARYDRHYRLSVPNIWSNTPWLTMNSATLNAYRARRIAEAVELLKEVSEGDTSWVSGIFLENEPRYWDTQSTEGTPQWAGEQWADFNPVTVEQAARDGVTLDPADGLAGAELAWLQRNVSRYFQQTVDVTNRALRAHGLYGRFPVYTHSLQVASLFPCCKMNVSPVDWARANGAQTGIEGIWSNLSDFERVREWGPWVNLNREETDGLPIETHLWDLRVAYGAGAGLFNSYNWHTHKGAGYPGYAATFLAALPAVEKAPGRVEQPAADVLLVTPPKDLQACDTLWVAVRPGVDSRPVARVAAEVQDPGGAAWFSQRAEWRAPGEALVALTFPAPAEMVWSAPSTVRLHAYDAAGSAVPGGARFAPDADQPVRMGLDLGRCRAMSRLVIAWRRARP